MEAFTSNTTTTLIVKHLPDFITRSSELQKNYFKPYKPFDVRFMEGPAMIGFAFLDFPDRDTAQNAYQSIQKINFGLYYKPVTVEYARPDPNRIERQQAIPVEEHEIAADPVSTAHQLLYPPNPHLRYYYPDPTPEIITNISYAIGTVPRLYTQVLHLMNKLNMPPPFGPLVKSAKPSLISKRKYDALLASDESELEDEQEQESNIKEQEEKIKIARLNRIAAEKQKLAITSHVQGTSTKSDAPHTAKIHIHAPTKLVPNEQQKALQEQCRPLDQLQELSAFKNYQAGAPSAKLYLKNLSKHTTQQDLIDLYSQFSQEVDVRLMNKGKLRDQAFVTFPNEAVASLALECTNGFLLHDRPLAVLFGRNPKK
ncbi:uncharacterized protein B0P05DRAFT_563131 [Gilbertella persicaria]|uniref:uncharacterized protein n=1 Tax=Gilbertella persicaria TaxID=101096 RepID=UPI00221F0083|nr:uncharacterized protein B0P05DRAFT_563131 [Gilbertella persicaria]KAI8050670.1 hypothetical protein B0P05DRAFT_563131 [Gilbertella persicaria]